VKEALVLEPPSLSGLVFHPDVSCTGCGQQPLMGSRFHCKPTGEHGEREGMPPGPEEVSSRGVDLCQGCFEGRPEYERLLFMELTHPIQTLFEEKEPGSGSNEGSTSKSVQPELPACYDVFDLEEGATDAEVRKAYQRASLLYHPDKNPQDPDAAERFNTIQEAYTTLISEPEHGHSADRSDSDEEGARGAASATHSDHTASPCGMGCINAAGGPVSAISTGNQVTDRPTSGRRPMSGRRKGVPYPTLTQLEPNKSAN